MVVALNETSRLMSEIDEIIEARGGWPLVGSVTPENEVSVDVAKVPAHELEDTSKSAKTSESTTNVEDVVAEIEESQQEVEDSGRLRAIDNLSPMELSNVLQQCVPERGSIDRQELLQAAARRLGFEKLNRRLRSRLNKTINADNQAGRLRTDWERV